MLAGMVVLGMACTLSEYSVKALLYTYLYRCLSFTGFQLRTDLVKFSQMLTVLQNHPVFQLREFENTIEYIRNVVAQVGLTLSFIIGLNIDVGFSFSFICSICGGYLLRNQT